MASVGCRATASWTARPLRGIMALMRRPLLKSCSASRSALVEPGPAVRDDCEQHAAAPRSKGGGRDGCE